MTAREDTIERIERVLNLTHKESITVTIPRLTAERAVSMLKEQEEKMKHLNNITLEYEKEVFRLQTLLKEQEAVEPFHRCIGKDFSLIEDSHFDYCPYCGKPITWAKQEGR